MPLVFETWGDYEQTHHGLYELANYVELYVLGAYGHMRRQIQLLNRYDACCFGGTEYVLYEGQVSRTAERVSNGSFRCSWMRRIASTSFLRQPWTSY